jgi:hypothetical protein
LGWIINVLIYRIYYYKCCIRGHSFLWWVMDTWTSWVESGLWVPWERVSSRKSIQ